MSGPCTIEEDVASIRRWYGKNLAKVDEKTKAAYVRSRDIVKWLKMAGRYSPEYARAVEAALRSAAAKKGAETKKKNKERAEELKKLEEKRAREEAFKKAQLSLI